jgi:DNA-binding Lrp family transcriptional regulator
MKAYILIHVRTGSINEAIRNMKRLPDILEVNMTFGPYDIVAVVRTEDINQLGHLIAAEIQPIPGVIDTLTCLVVEP